MNWRYSLLGFIIAIVFYCVMLLLLLLYVAQNAQCITFGVVGCKKNLY